MIRVDTWKKATIDLVDRYWSNTYYWSNDLLDGLVHQEMGGPVASAFTTYETGLHLDVVSYPLFTAYDADGDLTNGIAQIVHGGTYRGYWDHPHGMAPIDTVLRAAMYPFSGRPRQLYFKCSLGTQDLAMTETGHLMLKTIRAWDGIFQNAAANWMAILGPLNFYMRHNTRHPGSMVYVNPVKWAITGASELHAQERRLQRYVGSGLDLFHRTVDVVTEAARQWEVFWPVQFYHAEPVYGHIYFVPARASIGECKALVTEVKNYFTASGGSSGGSGYLARYHPYSDQIADVAGTLEGTLETRLEDLDNISWTGDPSNLHCSDADYHKIMQAVWDTAKAVAWLPSIDFRTPHTDQAN